MSGGVKIPGLSRRLREDVYDHVFDNHTHEVGGVLVGDLGDGPMPVVSGCIAALEARGERASVTFTHDAWSSIHAQMETDFPGKQIVGWYHSHPGFGIFLSGHDMFIQENFFSDPRQIAYVVDPHAGTEGVFGWRAGKVELLEQAPAGRRGTGGPDAPDEVGRPGGMVRYGGLAAVLLVFFGIGGALLLGGADNPPVAAAPLASARPVGGALGAMQRTYREWLERAQPGAGAGPATPLTVTVTVQTSPPPEPAPVPADPVQPPPAQVDPAQPPPARVDPAPPPPAQVEPAQPPPAPRAPRQEDGYDG